MQEHAKRRERMQIMEKKRKWTTEINEAKENFFHNGDYENEDTIERLLSHTLDHLKKARKAEEEYEATTEEIRKEYGEIHQYGKRYLEIIEEIVMLSKPPPELVPCKGCNDTALVNAKDGLCSECQPTSNLDLILVR